MDLRNDQILYKLFALFGIICIVAIIFNIPYHDTLYYWDWSRHPDLSYYDGPPMVAYIIRGFTTFFGSSSWALNVLAIFFNFAIAGLIYLLAINLFDARVARWSAAIWLLTPGAFLQYVPLFEYDTPATFFWMATLLFFYLAHKQQKNSFWYLAGFFGGCMMLSKYTGILLYIALFAMLIFCKPYRYLLKEKHLYFSAFLSLIIFLPVLIWNYRHGFASFLYQSQHGFEHQFQWSNLGSYFSETLVNYNAILLFFIFFAIRYCKNMFTEERFAILFYPALVSLLFFALVAPYSFKYNWNETFFMTAAILVAYYVLQSQLLNRLLLIILSIYSVILLVIVLVFASGGAFGLAKHLDALNWKRNVLAISQVYDHKEPVFASAWYIGSVLAYFLPEKPQIYAFPPAGNQYQYWSQGMMASIAQNKVQQILYVTDRDEGSLLNSGGRGARSTTAVLGRSTNTQYVLPTVYFSHCVLAVRTVYGRHPLYAYRCWR